MTDLTRIPAASLAALLSSREVSSVEATQAHLDRIAAVDGDVHAFLHVNAEAIAAAESVDARRAAGEKLGAIVDSVAKVSEVATPDVPATSHPIPLVNIFRPDVAGTTLTTEQALAGAPEHDGSRFKVSAILGEEQ